MTEADFEREATKLLRDLGLPSDTLNFFESDTANTSNWKSSIKAPPPPPKARRVSSMGTTSQQERRQRERAATVSVLKRPERAGIPWRNPSSYQDGSNATSGSRDSVKNRFSTGSPGVNVVSTVIPVSMSQPTPQNVSDLPQASSTTPTKRQVHRPAPRAPPPGYQSKSAAARRAPTPSRTSVSPARSTSPPAASQGSGIPVLSSRRLSPAPAPAVSSAASTTTTSNSINSNTSKSTNPPKPAPKPATSLSAKRPQAVVNQSSTAAEKKQNGLHAYESVDGSTVSCLTTTPKSSSSSSPPKSASFKKPNPNLSVSKHQEISRRLSAPEKRNRDEKAVLESQKSGESLTSSSKPDQLKMLQLLSIPKSSARKSNLVATKPDNKATVNGTKTAHPERTSVLSYSRIPVTPSSKMLPAARESKSGSAPPSIGSRIPQPSVSGRTWETGKSQRQPPSKQPQQPRQHEKKPETEMKVGNGTYDSLSPTPSPTNASQLKEEEFLLPEVTSMQKKANVSGAYDRLTPKELVMIVQGEDLPKQEDREKSPKVELKENGIKETPSDPVEHLYAKVNKRRRHSEDQVTSENRHSLTSPISDPGTADPGTSSVQIGKRRSVDEMMRSNSSPSPPSHTSSRDTQSSERSDVATMNGRSISIGSTTTTASSSDSVTDRQTPDSEERRSKIKVDWTKLSLDNNMSAVASSTVQALQTLVEVMTPQPSPLKTDKKFSYDNEISGTPWYLLDTEEQEESGESSHPISPASEPVTSPTTVPQHSAKVNGDVIKTTSTSVHRDAPVQRKSPEQVSNSSRKSSDPSNPQTATQRSSTSDKQGLSSRGSSSNRGKQLGGQTGVTGRTETGQSSKTDLPQPLVSRNLSSPDHDYAILEGPEHDYAILDPEFNENFFGKPINSIDVLMCEAYIV